MKAFIKIPSKSDQQKAAASIRKINGIDKQSFRKSDIVTIIIKTVSKDAAKSFEVPIVMLEHIHILLSYMAEGKAVEITSENEQLTTQEVANRLNVSRPYVIKLLEEGKMPFEKVGKHRRVRVKDVQQYEKSQQAYRSKQLDFLARQAQELNLGYE